MGLSGGLAANGGGGAQLGTDGTVGGPQGSPLTSSVVNAASAGASQVPIANGTGGYTWGSSQPVSPINLVTVAASPALTTKLAAGDANPAFQINGNGDILIGPGGTPPPDITITRIATNPASVNVKANIWSHYELANAVGIGTNLGTGGTAGITMQDATLYRSSAGTLKTDGVMITDPQTSASSLTTARVGGAAAAPPANPVKYLAMRDETGARVYVAAYS